MSRWAPRRLERGLARRAAAALRWASDSLDPSVAILRRRIPRPPARLACVYRWDNAGNVVELVGHALDAGWSVRLWALDRVHPALAAMTVSEGPGTRFELLNELASGSGPDEYIVVADDDIVLLRGRLDDAVGLAARYRLELCGIAHGRRSFHSHTLTLSAPFSVARITTFVEIGPVVIVAPVIRDRILPFPTAGMGWGVDVIWSALAREGHRLGIIDAVQLRHLAPPGTGYDVEAERARASVELESLAETSVDIRRTVRHLRLWAPAVGDRRRGARCADV